MPLYPCPYPCPYPPPLPLPIPLPLPLPCPTRRRPLPRRRHGKPNPHFRDGAFELTLHSIATYEMAAAPASTAGSGLVAVTPAAGAAASPALPAFGSCPSEAQRPLRWGSEREIANRICCHNSVYAEHGGYWKTTTFLASEGSARSGPASEVTFYDSVTGLALFVAPRGRSWEDFVAESTAHQWPSFRDEEVVWRNVRQHEGGEMVSTSGTHLGHNIPDNRNRYCINLVCVAGAPSAAADPAASPPPPAIATTTLARFDGSAAQRQWQVTNDPVMGGRSDSRLTVAGGVATFAGTCAIVPSLNAAGFCRMGSVAAALPDASAFAAAGALQLTLILTPTLTPTLTLTLTLTLTTAPNPNHNPNQARST